MEVEVDAELDSIVLDAGVAFGRGRWRMRTRVPDGRMLEQISRLIVVLRPVEGAWKITFAPPWDEQ